MISKEELRKHSKDELVNLTYDLFLKVDKLTSEVQELREEVKILKTPKNSGNSSLPPSHDLFRFKNQSLRENSKKKQVGKPVTRDGKAVKFPLEPESGREDMDGRITDGI